MKRWIVPIAVVWATPAMADLLPAQTEKVVAIDVLGTDRKQSVLLAMDLHPGDVVTPLRIQQDRQRIASLGYFSQVEITPQATPQGIRLVVQVKENPTVTGLDLAGVTAIPAETARGLFEPLVGDALNTRRLEEAKAALRQIYAEKGLVRGRVVASAVSPQGVLQILVAEGRISAIKVSGNSETKEHVILREMTLKPGDLFNVEQAKKDLQRVHNTGFFEDVNVHFEPQEDLSDVLVVEVKEKQTGSVTLGAAFDAQLGLVGQLRVNKSNLFGNGQTVGIDLNLGNSFFGSVSWYDPWFLEDRTSLGVNLYRQRYGAFFTNFIDDRTGASISVGRPLWGDPITSPLKGVVTLKGERVSIFDRSNRVAPELSITDSGTDNYLSLSAGAVYDTRDIIMNPTTGWYGQLYLTPTTGSATYLKANGSLAHYIPLAEWLTFAAGTRYAQLFGSTPDYERLWAFGLDAVRGWPENGILRGTSMASLQTELRFPIYAPVMGAVFADMGTYYEPGRTLDPAFNPTFRLGDLPFYAGTGLGIRLDTPMGAIRVDYGVRSFSPFQGQLHFNFGPQF